MSLREPHDNHRATHSACDDPRVLRGVLDRYVQQQIELAQLSRLALQAPLEALLDAAVDTLRRGLQADATRLLELISGEVEFRIRARCGGQPGDETRHIDATARTASGFALRHTEVVVVDDYEQAARFERCEWLERDQIRSAINARVPGLKRPYGVLAALSTQPHHFSDDDAEFIGTIANIVGEALERERAEQHRRRMYDELHRAMSAREEMLSVISHDLRSPAAAIKLSLELVRRAVIDPGTPVSAEQVERAIHKANSNLDRMMTMMDGLLAMSRAETDAFDIDWEQVDLCDVVDEVLYDYEHAIEKSASTIAVDAPDSVVGCWDWMRAQQVVANLVSNALKYGQGQPIEIEIAADDDTASLRVRDHGRGIPKAQQKRIFERYVRIDHRTGEEFEDSYGLGLWIVKRIVNALGGRIEVHSQVGHGTTFEVELPRKKHRQAQVEAD